MLKLVIDSYKFYTPDGGDKASLICSMKSTLINTSNSEVLAKFNNSTRIVKNDDDTDDLNYAKNIAFSDTKIKAYRSARNFMVNNLDINHLDTLIGIAYMNRFENAEINHGHYLRGEEDTEIIGNLHVDLLKLVLLVCPKLRDENPSIIENIENYLNTLNN